MREFFNLLYIILSNLVIHGGIMANMAYHKQKISLKFSKGEVNAAADKIRKGCSEDEKKQAKEIIQNFRAVHLYPLMLMKNHLARNAKRISKSAIVVRRLKRLDTIVDKLERNTLDGKSSNAIKLTRMQDIGGCRAIVKNKEQLLLLRDRLIKSSSVHAMIREKDYLAEPKSSGYGGIHLIYSCFENQETDNDWKKLKIEIQLRTELQHAWATSLEIIDTLEGFKLKTSVSGYELWRRFFYLTGLLIAHEERAKFLNKEELFLYKEELSVLEKELGVISKLASYSIVMDATTKAIIKNQKLTNFKGLFLIELFKNKERKNLTVHVATFNNRETELALEILKTSEDKQEAIITVLVAATDIKSLKKAYPNYFGSTKRFCEFISKQLILN